MATTSVAERYTVVSADGHAADTRAAGNGGASPAAEEAPTDPGA